MAFVCACQGKVKQNSMERQFEISQKKCVSSWRSSTVIRPSPISMHDLTVNMQYIKYSQPPEHYIRKTIKKANYVAVNVKN